MNALTDEHELLARALMRMAHEGQVDKAGMPYYLHPNMVGYMGKTREERIVGWLHDVVEDSHVTLGTIRNLFGDAIADPVYILTHGPGIDYDAYIRAFTTGLGPWIVARRVKIHDVRHNLGRVDLIDDERTRERLRDRYTRALATLEEAERLVSATQNEERG